MRNIHSSHFLVLCLTVMDQQELAEITQCEVTTTICVAARLRNFGNRCGEFRVGKLIASTYAGKLAHPTAKLSPNLSPILPSLVAAFPCLTDPTHVHRESCLLFFEQSQERAYKSSVAFTLSDGGIKHWPAYLKEGLIRKKVGGRKTIAGEATSQNAVTGLAWLEQINN